MVSRISESIPNIFCLLSQRQQKFNKRGKNFSWRKEVEFRT